MFQLIACNLAMLAIALLYYTWRDALAPPKPASATINERVAYMLWVAAHKSA